VKNNTYIFIILLAILGQNIVAQDTIPNFRKKKKQSYLSDTRKWNIEIPIWIPGFRGEIAYGDVELEGEDGWDPIPEHPFEPPNFGDTFKRFFKLKGNLNYFFVTSVAYQNKRFYGELDIFSGTIGSKIIYKYNNQELVSAKIHSDLARLNVGFLLLNRDIFTNKGEYKLSAFTGIRVHNINVKSNLNHTNISLNIHPLWIEPVLGIRNEFTFNYWKFVLKADMGSFDIDDKFSYMLNFYAFHRISNLLSLKMGWNDWYVNYNNRYRNENLKLKVHLAGPVAALVFNF